MNDCDTVLFDFGHTIVDLRASEGALNRAYSEIREYLLSLGQSRIPSVDDLVATVARRIDQLINDSYDGTNIEELSIVRLFDEVYREIEITLDEDVLRSIVMLEHQALSAAMVPADNAHETLRTLKDRGFKLGIVSNMTNLPEMMRQDLDRLGLLDFFDITVFSSEMGIRKPDPRIYRAALDGVGSSACWAVFVGDRIKEDVVGPQTHGMRAVLSHQFRQERLNGSRPDRVILDVAEIIDYLRTLSSA